MSLCVDGRSVRRVVVLGFGVTGRAVADLCLKRGLAVAVSDAAALTDRARGWLRTRGIPYEERGHTARLLGGADAVVLSPGVPLDRPAVVEAGSKGSLILSELDFAQLQAPPVPIIAVTGTNGKGTTVTLIDAILRSAGLRTKLGGNIGTPFASLLDEIDGTDAVVLEVSSFQLEQSEWFRPRVGVVLNLAPDHLERHRTMAAYAEAKGRLFRLQNESDVAVLPSLLRGAFPQGRGRRRFYDDPSPPLPSWSDRLSPHNRLNLAAALAAAEALVPDLDPAELPFGLLRDAFALPHRMTNVGSFHGVGVIDDSKSTNAHAAIAALRAVDGPVVLLLGGRPKGAGYEALGEEIERRDVRRIVLFGEAAGRLSATLGRAGADLVEADDLEQAVSLGFASARPGDTLLFSPACSSFDAFADFGARGDAFVELVRSTIGDRPAKDLSP